MGSSAARIRNYLLLHGPSPAREVYRSLEISQPTFSQTIAKMGAEVAVLGARRSARYALIRSIPEVSRETPIYFISESGEPEHAADLIAIQPNGFYVIARNESVSSAGYPDFPYWLNDVRPSGFLGRLIPRRHPELGFPDDVRLWTANHALRYAATLGRDLIGNVVLGDRALDLALRAQSAFVTEKNRATDYPRLAEETIKHGAAGSSAGGEQPKFLVTKQPSQTPVLVKFSPSGTDAINIRRRDLLICESHALETIREHGHDSAEAEIIASKDQIFLEVRRFDRIGPSGRRGVMTLGALSGEGEVAGWRDAAKDLERERKITAEMRQEILWRYYFGLCIANTDMHAGNLSFFVKGEKVLSLAPVYDMLPMAYAPRMEQIVSIDATMPTLYPQERDIWESAVLAARDFWEKVRKDDRVRREILRAAEDWLRVLKAVRD